MRTTKTEITIASIVTLIVLGFLVTLVSGCETWRGMGKDTRNLTDRTANTVGSVVGGNRQQ